MTAVCKFIDMAHKCKKASFQRPQHICELSQQASFETIQLYMPDGEE